MDINELYQAVGGSYDDILKILKSRTLINKYVLKFVDNVEYDGLIEALEEGDKERAFCMAHGLKGICQNIGFEKLQKSASEVTECLRPGNIEPSKEEFERYLSILKEDYASTYGAVLDYSKNK